MNDGNRKWKVESEVVGERVACYSLLVSLYLLLVPPSLTFLQPNGRGQLYLMSIP